MLPLLILFLWWWGARAAWWSPFLLPSPRAVFSAFLSLLENGELMRNVLASLMRIVKGFCVSAFFALAFAFACGIKGTLLRQFTPLLEFLRHIPPMATIPMLILWFGIGEASKLVIIVMAAFFPIFLNTVQGIAQCDRDLLDVARSFRYTPTQILRHVIVPFALPYIFTGMRLGLGYSWRSLIAAELVAASSGLGYMILDAEQLSRSDVILVGVFVIGLMGSVMDALLSALTARHCRRGVTDAVV